MSKKDHQNDSHTEVHVESHTEQHVSGGGDDLSALSADQAGDQAGRVEELTNDLKRVQAEFVNYKRRAEQERGETIDFAKNRVVREFLAVRDSFDYELAHRPAEVNGEWAGSIDKIRAQFDQILKNLGVERFESLGHIFDPHLHEAVMMAEDGEGEHEVVVEELQPGYKLGDTVLRHAMVKVGRSNKVAEAPPDNTDLEPSAEQLSDTKGDN